MAENIIVSGLVAERYANALYQLATESKIVDKIWNDLLVLKSLLTGMTNFRVSFPSLLFIFLPSSYIPFSVNSLD